jgi:hypothetical protein
MKIEECCLSFVEMVKFSLLFLRAYLVNSSVLSGKAASPVWAFLIKISHSIEMLDGTCQGKPAFA